jgi:dTDP-4-dehydrorhamnose reductase
MKQPSLLVVGGTGLVGNALVRAWAARGGKVTGATYHCHPSESFRSLDMQDVPGVARLLDELKPGVVAVPAANPHVDYCELHPEETRDVNVTGTLNVARAAAERGAPVVFYSSDYVFDGKKGSYTEDDPVSPLSEYGRQKAETEAAVLKLSPKNLVVRTSGAYGWQWEAKNFVLQVLGNLKAGKSMKVVDDVRYNPTYVENLAELVCDLLGEGRSGIYHAVGAEELSKIDFARLAAKTFGLDASLLVPVSSKEFNPPAKRPAQSSLRTDKLRSHAKTKVAGAREGLAAMKAFEPAWRDYAEKSLPQTVKR